MNILGGFLKTSHYRCHVGLKQGTLEILQYIGIAPCPYSAHPHCQGAVGGVGAKRICG